MWNGLALLRHWSLISGNLVFLFLGLISMWALANNGIYRPIEIYMGNSTSLSCTKNNFRSALDAAVQCPMEDGCRAAITWEEGYGDGHFGVCKCVTDGTQRTLMLDNSVMYLRISGIFSTGRGSYNKGWYKVSKEASYIYDP